MMAAEVSILPVWSNQYIRNLQEADANLRTIMEWVKSGFTPQQCPPNSTWQLKSLWTQRGNLEVKDSILYRQWEDIHIPEVLGSLHDSCIAGHIGGYKDIGEGTCSLLLARAEEGSDKWCADCLVCNSRKSPVKNRAQL